MLMWIADLRSLLVVVVVVIGGGGGGGAVWIVIVIMILIAIGHLTIASKRLTHGISHMT